MKIHRNERTYFPILEKNGCYSSPPNFSFKKAITISSLFSYIEAVDEVCLLFKNDKAIDKRSPNNTNPDSTNVAAPNPVATAVGSGTCLLKAFN